MRRVIGFGNLPTHKALPQTPDLVPIEIAEGIAHDGRGRRGRWGQAVSGERVQHVGFVGVVHATEDKYV